MSEWLYQPGYADVWQCYADLPVEQMNPSTVMALVTPGDGGPWSDELTFLWTTHRTETLTLLHAVTMDGRILEPIIIGNDGRLWDGHHRLAVAAALAIAVPARVVPPDAEQPSTPPKLYLPSADEHRMVRAALADTIGNVALHRTQPTPAVLDAITDIVITTLRWGPQQ